jgi:hypothetical protein
MAAMSPHDNASAVEALRHEAPFLAREERTCALVDWPVLDNVCRLLEAPEAIQDPFIALQDLATLIGALVFYDHLLVIDWRTPGLVHEPIARRAALLLELDDEIAGLHPTGSLNEVLTRPELPQDLRYLAMWGGPIGTSVHSLFWATVLDFDAATNTQTRWLARLQHHWERLLPATPWLPHTTDQCLQAFRPLSMSPANRPQPSIFMKSVPLSAMGYSGALRGARYEQVLADRAGAIVLDNDVRAVFHAAVASGLDDIMAQSSVTVRYVGGCLRTPVQLMLARLAKDSLVEDGALPLEEWMQLVWSGRQDEATSTVLMPFWFDAVVSGLDSPARLPDRVRAFRELAARFRARRRELEQQVVAGNRQVAQRLVAALVGDAAALTERTSEFAGGMVALADVALRMAAPTPVGIAQVGKGVSAALGSDWVTRLTMSIFHPELRVVHKLGKSAALLGNSLPRAFSLFNFESADAAEPLTFLNRLGEPAAIMN